MDLMHWEEVLARLDDCLAEHGKNVRVCGSNDAAPSPADASNDRTHASSICICGGFNRSCDLSAARMPLVTCDGSHRPSTGCITNGRPVDDVFSRNRSFRRRANKAVVTAAEERAIMSALEADERAAKAAAEAAAEAEAPSATAGGA